jgi:hypothetical protein
LDWLRLFWWYNWTLNSKIEWYTLLPSKD